MAVRTKQGSWGASDLTRVSRPKKTRQGNGKCTKYAATARNSARKPYRGQGNDEFISGSIA